MGSGCCSQVRGRGRYAQAAGLRVSSGAWVGDLAGHPRERAVSPPGMKAGAYLGSKEGNPAFPFIFKV